MGRSAPTPLGQGGIGTGAVAHLTYDGRTVEYGDAADLLKRIRVIEREMAAVSDGAKPSRSLAAFTKG